MNKKETTFSLYRNTYDLSSAFFTVGLILF